MNLLSRIWRSSLGKKYVMAVTGGALFLFVIGHMLGNLQIFLGAEAINRYGHVLQSTPEILWPARIGLLACVILHIVSAVKLSAENKAARPVAYATSTAPVAASYASRTMLMSGLIIAAFIIYHLLHFTAQVKAINFAGPDFTGQDFGTLHDAQGRHDIFKMMVLGFKNPFVSGFYILAMALLCLHLSHGVSAMFQSLGLKCACCPCLPKCLAKGAALVIFLGNSSIPMAILLGYGKEVLK